MAELARSHCLVVYDVPDDDIRTRFSESCLDYGLERFQFSAFWGSLSAPQRKELFHRLEKLLGDKPGRILVQPVGAEDVGRRSVLHRKAEGQLGVTDNGRKRKPRHFPEPGSEKPTILKW
jgi:CRISPR-associated protein Cas2